MSELWTVHHFTFSAPGYLAALAVVPLLLAFAAAVRRRRSRYAVLFTNLPRLRAVSAGRRTRWRRRVPLIVLVLALSTTAAALARPGVEVTVRDQGATVILLVDVSGSMQASDVAPSRIDAAVTAMHGFLDKLPRNDKVGLVTFSDKVRIVNTPSTDHSAVNSSLDVLNPETGTSLGDGVVAAVRLAVATVTAEGIRPKPGDLLPAAIVLESDGAQNHGSVTPQAAAELARAAGVRIYGVALGTKYGVVTSGPALVGQTIPVPPDPGTVALLSRISGGQAYNAASATSLTSIYKQLGSTVGRRNEPREITSWFEVAGAALLVLAIGAARFWGASLP
jgi:Ca-activated chloride channel family protein